MKKFFSIIIISIMFFSLAGFAFAQDRELEVDYPEVAGEQPEETTTPVTEYFKYIFNFLVGVSGIIALFVLINAGMNYITSAGNPEAINDSKSKIAAALLGILILFGSYLILTTINPDLIVFHLPRLRPIMSELPAGVLLCSGQAEVYKAWKLAEDFKKADSMIHEQERIDEQKRIKKESDAILDKIALNCSTVIGKGDIIGDIQFIYFIPDIQRDKDGNIISATEYGAIIYEDSDFEGKSEPLYGHLLPGGTITAYEMSKEFDFPSLNPSSIKPFVLIPKHDGGYELKDPEYKGLKFQVSLFQEYNRNTGTDLEDTGVSYGLKPENYWHEYEDITGMFCSRPGAKCEENYCSPRSIQVIGNYIAILVTPDGKSDTFYNEIDNNLDDNLNIVNWVDCKDYESTKIKEEITTPQGAFGVKIENLCAQPAIKKLIIISAKIY